VSADRGSTTAGLSVKDRGSPQFPHGATAAVGRDRPALASPGSPPVDAGLRLDLLLTACGGMVAGAVGGSDTPAATMAGTLRVSTVGGPGQTVVAEAEPNHDPLTADVLGSRTPGLTYRVLGAIPPGPDPDVREFFWLVEPPARTVAVSLRRAVGPIRFASARSSR